MGKMSKPLIPNRAADKPRWNAIKRSLPKGKVLRLALRIWRSVGRERSPAGRTP
jgi:hypothetical protein